MTTFPDYEIVTTLGPASRTPAIWQALREAGASCFRLNTSHLELDELETWLAELLPFCAAHSPLMPVVLDLQGSKWRLGQFVPFTLRDGETVELLLAEDTLAGARGVALPVPHADFFAAAGLSNGQIALNDAKILLVLEGPTGGTALRARVLRGGGILPRKGITFTACDYRQERMSEKDRAICARTAGLAGVRYAISYVRDAAEMERYRAQFSSAAHLIAKVERQAALDEAPGLCAAADELWLCRGDLGAELGLPAMAHAAHAFGQAVTGALKGKPALLAGQVLEHMAAAPAPTRAEVCGIFDALTLGYAGVVLSDETAVGINPVEAVKAAAMFKAL
jgi:pyruvate kinase